MGWFGVATLIAAACYLIYRHPPATWAPQPPSEKTSAKPPTTGSTRDAVESLEPDVLVEDTQSTPKASATNVPSIEIPSLHLDNETKPVAQNDHQSRHNGPIDPLSPPSTATAATSSQPKPSNGSLMLPPPLPVPQLLPPSPQPSATASTTSSKTTSMPPPPLPRLRPIAAQQQPQQSLSSSLTSGRYPPRPTNPAAGPAGSLRPPPSAASSLRAPPSRSSPSSLAPTKLIAKPLSSSASNKNKHILQPGYSPLDWAALTSNPNNNLRGKNLPPTLIRVTPSMLKAQNGRKGADAWTSYQGKVYNITPYLPFHPGGKGELLRGVGKDSGQLFMEIHPWVNWDAILGECLVGILVAETEAESSGGGNELDAMD
ncbi:cytochrome b5-like heme/steroid binding domain-containing protein [Aspergillus brunneoviolaceus CBS 621.78]|uniref:Uncharacterized protein n=1 Tax=Aspergillus brunneoviolaceus CBS 621.78 TaxID=1450534 RepID=A0ACD1G4A8_9EURO|nr:hypothetical protein BO95DRAFT_444560 [Aspergillus brunneoviolaceus CBS 621.78]RAH43998.1 hypothetical protein BO95DRAFT_444560 [Aspergillus brunneoviolaceus CBS 621.78]